jgi:undecaprenyl-diphosphatase
MKRDDAARFGFLLGIPAIILSGLLELKEMLAHGLGAAELSSLAVGLVSSTVVSYLAIAWLVKFLQTHSTWVFICYRLVFGISLILLAANKLIR